VCGDAFVVEYVPKHAGLDSAPSADARAAVQRALSLPCTGGCLDGALETLRRRRYKDSVARWPLLLAALTALKWR
jgi:hypothetical protein